MDGHFVPNLTFGPAVVSALRKISKRLFLDVHLMIEDPVYYAPIFIEAGANCITFHQEVVEKPERLINKIHRLNAKAGISLKPKTPLDSIAPFLKKIDLVMIMSVEPGFGGQKLIPKTLNKMRELRLLKEKMGLDLLIEVDGGINAETAPLAVAAGADVLVAGSYIFGDRRVAQNVKRLYDVANRALEGRFDFNGD
jgi:ribulose-phosphate 3-epimerase